MDHRPTTLAFVALTAPFAIPHVRRRAARASAAGPRRPWCRAMEPEGAAHVRIGGDASHRFLGRGGVRPVKKALAVADDANARMAG